MITMMPITVCLTYFKSLGLANLRAALHSVRRQDLSRVEAIVVVDNDTEDSVADIEATIQAEEFPLPVSLMTFKHGDPSKTHSWSSNIAVKAAFTPWILFTRADYVLDFSALMKMSAVVQSKPEDWDGFVTGNVYHLNVDVLACERVGWREYGVRSLLGLPGIEESHTAIDAGVWLARRNSFNRVGGLDESLTAWGHAQTHFQHKLYNDGVEFVRISEPLFYHPLHSAPRDIELAHAQIRALGVDLWDMWARHDGFQPYGRAS